MEFVRFRKCDENVYDLTFRVEGATKANCGMLKLENGAVKTFTPGPHGGSAPVFKESDFNALFQWNPPEGVDIEIGQEYEYPK